MTLGKKGNKILWIQLFLIFSRKKYLPGSSIDFCVKQTAYLFWIKLFPPLGKHLILHLTEQVLTPVFLSFFLPILLCVKEYFLLSGIDKENYHFFSLFICLESESVLTEVGIFPKWANGSFLRFNQLITKCSLGYLSKTQ